MATEGEPDSGKPGAWSMQNPEMRSGHGRGRIGKRPAQARWASRWNPYCLDDRGVWPARQPRRLDPIPPDVFFPLGQPSRQKRFARPWYAAGALRLASPWGSSAEEISDC